MSLESIFNQKQGQDYYTILEITQEATKSELRKARRKLISKYHPDKHTGKDKDFAIKISSLINDAFEALNDDDFRDKYDMSGLNLKYSISDVPDTIVRVKEEEDSRRKGLTLTAIVDIPSEILINGGKVEARPLPLPEIKVDLTPREIIISPRTKIDSFLIYKGLGEKKESGHNGDLIVFIRCKEKLTAQQRALNVIHPQYPILDIKIDKEGVHEIDLGKPFDKPILINKQKKEVPSLMLIRDCEEIGGPLIINY